MLYQSFLLGNQLLFSLLKKIYSVVLVGLYYGFMTTFSIVPYSVFLFVGFIIHPVEGTEKVSATTGLITGQFIMLISIFSAPLYLALSRPHTITVLAFSYLLFHFFWQNHKNFCDFGYKTSSINLMRNLSIPCIFLNNHIFQIFNLFLLPSSMLSRVVNIVLFRCKNKILFVTSSFIGWLIGIILFMKWIRFGYVCIRQKNSNGLNRRIRSGKNILSGTSINNLDISIFLNIFSENITKFVGSNTYYHSRLVKNLVSELINYMSRILSILLFITCVYYLVRIPSPIRTQKRKKTSEIQEERAKRKAEKEVVEIEKTSGIKESQEDISTKNTYRSLFLEEKLNQEKILDENKKLTFEKKKEDNTFLWLRFETLVTLLFDYQQRNRPLRYIKNDQLENDVRNEMSQYFFYTCPSDGKLKISFTYLSSLFTFFEMIQKKISLSTIDSKKQNHWRYTNEQKKNKLSNDFLKRMDALDNQYGLKKILEKRTRLCNNDQEYLKKIYDPFVNGTLRGITKNISYVPSIKEPFIKNSIDRVWINKIHGIFITYSRKFQPNKKRYEAFDKNLLLIMQKLHFLTFISQFDKKTEEFTLHFWKGLFLFPKQEKMDSEYREKKNLIFFLKRVIEFKNIKSIIIKKSIGVKTICQKVPKWSYKLIDELEQQLGEEYEEIAENHHDIRSRKAKRIVIFTDNDQKNNSSTTTTNMNNETYDPDQVDEIALIRYSPQSDFRREIIKGTMRTQRRKTVILELFQVNTHSPLFFDRISKIFNCEILKQMKFIFINKMSTISQLKNSTNNITEERKQIDKKDKKVEEKLRIEKIAEAWETILFYQRIRGCMLIIQSIIRKYLFIPSLIIAKNFSRMLLFQSPEWSDDFKEWNREMHIKCTYNGVQLSEKEFPKNWLTDGLQIKILFPFCLKPWRYRLRSSHMDAMKKKTKKDVFCFLTVWGMEADLPFGSPRKQPSFFEPVFKTLKKKIIKLIKKNFFLVLRFLIEKIDVDLRISKKRKEWFMKNIFKRIKNLSKKKNKKNLLGNENVSEIEDSKINWMIHDSYIPTLIDYRKDSMAENKMSDLIDRTKKITNKIIRKKENQKEFLKKKMDIKKKTRLRMKSYQFIINEMENSAIYIYILFIKNLKNFKNKICTFNAQLFFESIIKMIENMFFSELNQDKWNNKTNQTTIHLMISTLKESIYLKNCKINPHLFRNLSLSQTYLFYQFSKIQVHKLDQFRHLFQYHGTSLFLKSEIKDLFGMQGIHSDSKLRIKVLKSETKQWKMWLLSTHSQYYFSPIRWSQRSKWRRNRVMNQYIVLFYRCDLLYDVKVQLIHHYKKKTDYEEVSLSNKKYNVIKNYFDHNSKILKYEYNATNCIKGSPLHVRLKKKKERKNYNYNKHKQKLIDQLGPFYNYYLGEDKIRDIDKNLSIYINCPIKQHFCFKKLYIDTLIDIGTGTNPHHLYNITGTNNPGMERIDKKKTILSLTIYQKEPSNSKIFLNWMGLNKEILINCLGSNKLSFLPEIFLDYQYKMKPWLIRIQRLFLHFNENVIEKKNINTTNSKESFALNAKDFLELENTNQQKGWTGRGKRSDVQNQDSILSNQLDFEEVDTKSNRQKHRKKKYNHTETELDLFLKRYFFFQMRWDEPLNPKMITNIKVYCLLLRLKNTKNMVLSSIQRGEISLDRMLNKDISLKELLKTGILIIEPVRQSLKKDRKFIMVYQTVTISLVRQNELQTNPKYQEKNIDLITFQSIEKKIQMIGKKDEKNDIDSLFFPENILSARRCREFRVRMCFYSNKNRYHNNIINLTFFNTKNNVKNYFSRFMDENENLDRKHKKNKVKKVNLLFWANYRFEDLTCMNRYWYNPNKGSHFSMLRICDNN